MPHSLPKPTLIFHHCNIFQSGDLPPGRFRALAVSDNRIVAIGTESEILALADAQTEVVDGNGGWLLPALSDSHTHVCEYAARKQRVDLTGCGSIEEALEKIRRTVEAKPSNSWVLGGGWDKNRWGENTQPHKRLLDQISRQHYLVLQSKDWHSLWVNSPVLEVCGIDATTADPEGGVIDREPDSREPTGILRETACRPVYQAVPPLTFEEISPLLQDTFREFHQWGITSVHSMETADAFSHYTRLEEKGELGLRIFWYFPRQFLQADNRANLPHKQSGDRIKICGVKLFADGALGSQSAAMLEPYRGGDNTGIEVMSAGELEETIHRAIKQGWSCAVHAIGDRANRNVLRTFAKFSEHSQTAGLRHRIEHAQLLHPDDIPLFAPQNVIASMQPIHLTTDIPLIEKFWGERGRYAFAFRSLKTNGARLIFGSDTPVETFNPWKGIYTARERKYRCDPAETSFYPEESISINDALEAYTRQSAYAVSEEAHLGTLEAGKLADFILVDRDVFHLPAEELLYTRVLFTVFEGKIVYRAR